MEQKVIPCEVYSRVVGYFRPVNNWNKGKQQEFTERLVFDEGISMKNPKAIADVSTLVLDSEQETYNNFLKLFTVPHCEKCEEVKSFLKERELEAAIFDLKSPEGNKEFRNHYSDKKIKEMIKRDDSGALKLPIILRMQEGNIVAAQGIDELKSILA